MSTDIFCIVDAINKTDELIGKPLAGPPRKMLLGIIEQAIDRFLPAIRIKSITHKRSHTNGVDRDPTSREILSEMPYLIKTVKSDPPKMVILVGDLPEKYYKKEFEDAVCIKAMWLYRKNPALIINAITAIKEKWGHTV